MCDQISDAVVDAIIAREAELAAEGYVTDHGSAADPEYVRCGVETFTTTGLIVVGGEVRTHAYVDIQKVVRDTVKKIGYTDARFGFDYETCGVLTAIHEQSADIAMGVDEAFEAKKGDTDPLDLIGAGDQGMMFGYACDETSALMPMPIHLAHRLAERLTAVRKSGVLPYLRPDGKTQVTVRYVDGKPVAVEKILISTQHAEEADVETLIRPDLIEHVIKPVFATESIAYEVADEDVFINPTGRFVIGGPMGDSGLTGRKIIVDTYGGMGRHGGGAFSGKDCTKVDRSATYAARWVAKNVVAAGLASRCEIQLAYAIGVAHPLSILVETFGTETVAVERIERAVAATFDLRPGAIIRDLELRRPIYSKTAAYGHFGRDDVDFTWERTDRVEALKAALGD
jgi:S-adenosylmethionine synthetase